MNISLIPFIAFLICILPSNVENHATKIPSSAISPLSLSVDNRRRLARNKVNGFEMQDTLSPLFLQSTPLTLSSTSTDHHFQWWDSESSPELVQSGWYGFNQFIPRGARNLANSSNRKGRTTFLLGESTRNSQTHPLRTHSHRANFKVASKHHANQFNEDFAIHKALRELQRQIRPLPQRQTYLEPRIIMIEEAIDLPPGVLVPIVHPEQNNYRQHSSYRRPQRNLKRLASTPTPVTIKVVPLKITSMDIANALKTMSFFPIPLEFMQGEEKHSEINADVTYDDKTSNNESDLPRPSSHVATPLEQPLGITYAEAQQAQHYLGKYQPRR